MAEYTWDMTATVDMTEEIDMSEIVDMNAQANGDLLILSLLIGLGSMPPLKGFTPQVIPAKYDMSPQIIGGD